MKVGQVPGVTGVYNKQGVAKTEKAKEVQGKKDVVSISNSGQDYNVAMKALREIPNVRMEKVEELSQQIESGKYNPSGDKVVETMIKNIVDKKV